MTSMQPTLADLVVYFLWSAQLKRISSIHPINFTALTFPGSKFVRQVAGSMNSVPNSLCFVHIRVLCHLVSNTFM